MICIMTKIPYNDLVLSMTMFFLNSDIDNKYFELRKNKLATLRAQLKGIDTRTGLVRYIKGNENALENLLVLLGISTELFKRVISLFRIERGMFFSSEWDVKCVRKYILNDELMMAKVCDLFLKGPDDPMIGNLISKYRLSNFVINEKVIKRIQNDDFMDFLISKDFDTAYNADVSQSIINIIDDKLNSICKQRHYILKQNCNVDAEGNGTQQIQVNYAIHKDALELPIYYIKYSFNVTTSRGQTDFKRSVQNLRAYIKRTNPNAKQIAIIDGAGWVARQSDFHDVWDYCDSCLNLKHINEVIDIIK